MHDGTTLIVDVETLGENSYALSLPAEDLWVAYEVVRRHVDANGVRHYSQMTEAKTTANGYSFKFDTGDTFTCSSHLDRPTSSTLSDTSSELPAVGANDKNKYLHTNESTGALEWAEGGSGGGALIVTRTADTLDKTWNEIVTAMTTTGAVLASYVDGAIESLVTFKNASMDEKFGEYIVATGSGINGTYVASDPSGYPVQQSE